MKKGTVATLLIVVIVIAALAGYIIDTANQGANFKTYFHYPISVNYSGSWNLVYWGENGTATQINVKGNLNGTGNYETTVMLYGVGYVMKTLCANATKLDSHNNLTLTLTLLTGPDAHMNSTTASSPSAEVCVTFAV